MSFRVPATHPLHPYHRRRPPQAGHSVAEVLRQWGHADVIDGLDATGATAGSYQTVTVRFTVGRMGLDEDGGFKLSFRFVSDAGVHQATDPRADDYVTARCSGRARIELQPERKGSLRPFQRTLFVHVRDASLAEGDTVELVLGDTAAGGRGWRQQTYVEAPFPVRVAVDPLGTHDYQELPYDLGWDLLPGPAERFVVNAPSFGAPGAPLRLRVKAEDAWGNPLFDLAGARPDLRVLTPAGEVAVTDAGAHDAGIWTFTHAPVAEGPHGFKVAGTALATRSNPCRVTAAPAPFGHYWCDLHGQTGETVGSGTVERYFEFGRRYAFLDGSVHQGNDFQIGSALWTHVKRVSDAAYAPGAFVTFPGYEWSGTEAMGGDHNVIFHESDPPIYRSSGWLDEVPFEEHAPLPRLYEALRPHRALTIAHVGGRPASFAVSDAQVEPLWEVHSAWGTFEWVIEEAAARGFRVGFVANSDGHKCRPGASFPGAGIFGTLGGLTCVLSRSHDRDGFWDALRSRRTYATTGARILVEASANGAPIGADVRTDRLRIPVRVLGTAPIERVELLQGHRVVASEVAAASGAADAPAGTADATTVVVRFGGARVRGRARMVRWDGAVTLEGNAVASAEMHGVFSPAYGIRRADAAATASTVAFSCVTTGNTVNLALTLERGLAGRLRFAAGAADVAVDLQRLTRDPRRLFEAPLDQRVEVFALHRSALPTEVAATFELPVDHDDVRPYFVRVTQLDEAKAWTSPFYVGRPT